MKNRIFFVIYLIFNPNLLKTFLNRIYLPIYIQFEWLKKYKIKTIVDVGAYNGDVLQTAAYIFPQSKVYAFEPNEDNHRSIRSKISKDRLIICANPVSDKARTIKFYNYKNYPALSSFLPVEELFKKVYSVNPIAKISTKKTTTLDTYFKRVKLSKNILLNIDTQGSESLVIDGAIKFLKKVAIIIIEVSFEKYYKDQKMFAKIYEQLTKLGFEFRGETRESEFYPTFGVRNQVNVVFINPRLFKF